MHTYNLLAPRDKAGSGLLLEGRDGGSLKHGDRAKDWSAGREHARKTGKRDHRLVSWKGTVGQRPSHQGQGSMSVKDELRTVKSRDTQMQEAKETT